MDDKPLVMISGNGQTFSKYQSSGFGNENLRVTPESCQSFHRTFPYVLRRITRADSLITDENQLIFYADTCFTINKSFSNYLILVTLYTITYIVSLYSLTI